MKYVAILFALAVVSMLAVPALAGQNGDCNGDCVRECTTDCPNVPDGAGNQNGNGQNGNPDGQAQDGTGPIGDGSCKA